MRLDAGVEGQLAQHDGDNNSRLGPDHVSVL